jgi:hypothetical protein
MGRFADVTIKPAAVPPERFKSMRRERLHEQLSASAFRPWEIGDRPTNDVTITLGVASFSGDDMALLDELETKLDAIDRERLSIAVFLLDDCRSLDDVRNDIPTIEGAYQSPLLGLWRNGILTSTFWGDEARTTVHRVVRAEIVLSSNRPVLA